MDTHEFPLLSDNPVLVCGCFIHHDLKDGGMHMHIFFKVFPLIRGNLPLNWGGRWSKLHVFYYLLSMNSFFAKRNCSQQKTGMVEMDAKPTLDTEDLPQCTQHSKEWKRKLRELIHTDKKVRSRENRILRKWREKQDELLGYDDEEDPDPYQPTYVFYCLEARRQD